MDTDLPLMMNLEFLHKKGKLSAHMGSSMIPVS